MKRTSLLAAALLLTASGARAQNPEPQAPAGPPTPQAPAAATAPVAGQAAGTATPGGLTPDRIQRIYHIRQIESMLTNAVKAGAASVANQIRVGDPNSLFVIGGAHTRGFELEGYGIFFDVDVPPMLQSAVWTLQVLQQQQYVDTLQRRLADPRLDDNTRRMASFELRRVQRALANGQIAPIPNAANPLSAPPQAAAQGMAVAQTTDNVTSAPAPPAAMEPVAPPPDPRSPDELYTDAIKGVLIDAMLNYGNALQLGDGEWLTIAARASNQGTPGQLDDSSSILIRIKGSDLSAFLKGRLTREEVTKKIEIKEG